jgi:triosephosphate isomerase
MRKKIIAGNWKMNLGIQEAQALTSEVLSICQTDFREHSGVILFPSFTNLTAVAHLIKENSRFSLGAQNMHDAEKGSFTGEISAEMIKSTGASHVLVGHSERRQLFGESGEFLARKVTSALKFGLTPVFCFGETLEQREASQTTDIIVSQIKEGLFHLAEGELSRVILAYEPVWAIGTGKTASPEQAQEVHYTIRHFIASGYSENLASALPILYGGSVSPTTAKDLFSMPDIDGGLVGGASLKSRDFCEIIRAAI